MKPRTTAELTSDALTRLNDNPDFHIFLGILKDRSAAVAKGLRKICTDQVEIAHHNHLVGVLDGLTAAYDVVTTVMAAALNQPGG